MNKLVSLLGLAAALLFAGNINVSAQRINPSVWHYQLNQSQRNAYIVTAARSQLGVYGDQCKVWVYNLIPWICGVQIPLNGNSGTDVPVPWHWITPAANVQYVNQYQSIPSEFFQPGWIIQMKYTSSGGKISPHTAIVSRVTANSMFWIDSNWPNSQGLHDGIVREHEISHVAFRAAVGSLYSVYQIY